MAKSNRRTFLAAAAAASGSLALARTARSAASGDAIRLGLIGAGGYGMADTKAAFKVGGVRMVSICDVDSSHLESSADAVGKLQGSRPKTYKHYEEMLDAGGLDAVIIATPPQWHALPFLAALDKGLAIYCEKPLAYDVREGRAMVDAAAKRDNVVQLGFQRRQSQAMADAAKFMAEGKAGKIVQVDAQIHYRAGTKDPAPQDPPPELDWDLWCGPAPKIPYSPQVGHHSWRLEKTTGHGHLVDWGIHLVDAVRNMLDLGMPKQITAAGGLYQYKDIITTPDTLTACFEFDRLPLVWRHRLWGAQEYSPEVNNGIFFFGDEATVFATDRRWEVIPVGKADKREVYEVNTDMGTLHMADFLKAVRGEGKPSCLIADAFQSTATVQLAMIAYETASTVRWDASDEQILDNPAAAKLLKREYRAPYQHPYRK